MIAVIILLVVAMNAGPYHGIMNVTAVLAEHMVAASLQLGFRT